MKKDSVIDYLSCILFRLFGPLIRSLPLSFGFFLGRRLGELFYYFDLKHKLIAYSNIKTAFGTKLPPSEISSLTQEFYRSFGQNLMEIFFIPLINKKYINKYITFEGLEHISEGFKRGKGVIFLGIHEGSWELSNIICANLGFPFSLFVREQRLPRLNKLLNQYRSQKGCRIIERQNQTRQLIEELKNNGAIGMTIDQGGKTGTLVKFFGKDASMPSGTIRLALKFETALIPVFFVRLKGPYVKIFIAPSFQIKQTGNKELDIRHNLQEVIHIFEKYILKYSSEYLWSYKIWKYTKEKNILILSDGKTGHLRQAEALANIISNYFKNKGVATNITAREAKLKNKFSQYALTFSSCLSGKYTCQGCLWCLKTFLQRDTYKSLINIKPDIIISCGSSVAGINFVLARENLAKSIAILRPSILSTKRFDLVIAPRHDRLLKKKNVVVTEGALNLIDESYLKEQSDKLMQVTSQTSGVTSHCIGLLIGGDTKNFRLTENMMLEVIRQIKSTSEKWNADILVTTSRRTSPDVENLVKEEFKDYPHCKLLVIANEKNLPPAVGGILGLSSIVITSPESISMISEAASSNRYVLIFESLGLNRRHQIFLNYLNRKRYIYLTKAPNLNKAIDDIWLNKSSIHVLRDNFVVSEAIRKIL